VTPREGSAKDGGSAGSAAEVEEEDMEVVCDALVACAGTKPDPSLLSECHVHLCYATEGPMKLAAALMAAGGGGGDCLAQVGQLAWTARALLELHNRCPCLVATMYLVVTCEACMNE
jgi:hypothetical protein